MKKRYTPFVILLLISVGLLSCSKWLDIDPKLDVFEETLFEDARGYYAALNGLYVTLSSEPLYGKELSWGAMEAWGRGYTLHIPENKTYNDMAEFDYGTSEVKKITASIWLSCFNVIAEANNLIEKLEKDQTTAFPVGDVVKNMILGEAYAIRAMMHFEAVRIFARSPVSDHGGVSAFVPFVDKYPSKVNTPLPTKEILARVIADLEKAKALIEPFDTDPRYPGNISYNSISNVGYRLKLTDRDGGADDEFFRYRANRLSYYPMVQLLARVCLYAGDNDKAFEYANEIVTLVDKKKPYDFINPAYIGDPTILDVVEPRLHSEILFGAYNLKLKDRVKLYFDPMEQSGRWLLRVNDKLGIFADNLNDCRLKAIPQDFSTKYSARGKDEKQMLAAQSLIPVLRFLECFYIAAESVLDKDKGKAVEIFNKAVTARNNPGYKVDVNISREDFIEALVKEYRREFLSEGVMVFVYKRLNLPLRDNGTTVDHMGRLVMPIPDSEAGVK